MAATGYLLTAFLIWAVLTALGAVHTEQPPTRTTRQRRGRTSRAYARRLRTRPSAPLVASSLNTVGLPGE